MPDDDLEKLSKRVTELEEKMKGSVPKKDKKPREPSEFNKFMGTYIKKNKDPKKTHRELFAEAIKAWNDTKKK